MKFALAVYSSIVLLSCFLSWWVILVNRLIVLAFFSLISATSIADESHDMKWSLYGAIGSSSSNTDAKDYSTDINGCELRPSICTTDDSDATFQLGVSRRLNQYFSIGGQYTYFGNTHDFSATTSDEVVTQRTRAFSVLIQAEYPVFESVSPFVELGLGYYKSKAKYDTWSYNIHDASRDSGFTKIAGIGLKYKHSDVVSVSFGMQRFFSSGESTGIAQNDGGSYTGVKTHDAILDYKYMSMSYAF
jgi:hypothetical protein